jgi:hypothetical protein
MSERALPPAFVPRRKTWPALPPVPAPECLAAFDARERIYHVPAGSTPESMVIAALSLHQERAVVRLSGRAGRSGQGLPAWTLFVLDVWRLHAALAEPYRTVLQRAYMTKRPLLGTHAAAACGGRCARHFGAAALARELGIASPPQAGRIKRDGIARLVGALFPEDAAAARVTGRTNGVARLAGRLRDRT